MIEFGSVNSVSGGGVELEDPPNRLAIPEINPPSPPMLPNPPPVKALATPLEALCESRFPQDMPLDVEVLLLDGLPKESPLLSLSNAVSDKLWKPSAALDCALVALLEGDLTPVVSESTNFEKFKTDEPFLLS